MFDESAPWGLHAYEKAVYLDELTDGAIDVDPRAPSRRRCRRCRSSRSSCWAARTSRADRRRDRRSAAAATSATSSTSPARTPSPDDLRRRTGLGARLLVGARRARSRRRQLRQLHDRVRRGPGPHRLRRTSTTASNRSRPPTTPTTSSTSTPTSRPRSDERAVAPGFRPGPGLTSSSTWSTRFSDTATGVPRDWANRLTRSSSIIQAISSDVVVRRSVEREARPGARCSAPARGAPIACARGPRRGASGCRSRRTRMACRYRRMSASRRRPTARRSRRTRGRRVGRRHRPRPSAADGRGEVIEPAVDLARCGRGPVRHVTRRMLNGHGLASRSRDLSREARRTPRHPTHGPPVSLHQLVESSRDAVLEEVGRGRVRAPCRAPGERRCSSCRCTAFDDSLTVSRSSRRLPVPHRRRC